MAFSLAKRRKFKVAEKCHTLPLSLTVKLHTNSLIIFLLRQSNRRSARKIQLFNLSPTTLNSPLWSNCTWRARNVFFLILWRSLFDRSQIFVFYHFPPRRDTIVSIETKPCIRLSTLVEWNRTFFPPFFFLLFFFPLRPLFCSENRNGDRQTHVIVYQAPIVQRLASPFLWMNLYPVQIYLQSLLSYYACRWWFIHPLNSWEQGFKREEIKLKKANAEKTNTKRRGEERRGEGKETNYSFKIVKQERSLPNAASCACNNFSALLRHVICQPNRNSRYLKIEQVLLVK